MAGRRSTLRVANKVEVRTNTANHTKRKKKNEKRTSSQADHRWIDPSSLLYILKDRWIRCAVTRGPYIHLQHVNHKSVSSPAHTPSSLGLPVNLLLLCVIQQFYIVVSGVIRVSRRAVLTEGAAELDQEVNRLLAGSNFGAGELLAGRCGLGDKRNMRFTDDDCSTHALFCLACHGFVRWTYSPDHSVSAD